MEWASRQFGNEVASSKPDEAIDLVKACMLVALEEEAAALLEAAAPGSSRTCGSASTWSLARLDALADEVLAHFAAATAHSADSNGPGGTSASNDPSRSSRSGIGGGASGSSGSSSGGDINSSSGGGTNSSSGSDRGGGASAQGVHARLEELRRAAAAYPAQALCSVNAVLARHGYRPCDRYGEPADSALSAVLEGGAGSCLALSILYAEVCRRIGLPMCARVLQEGDGGGGDAYCVLWPAQQGRTSSSGAGAGGAGNNFADSSGAGGSCPDGGSSAGCSGGAPGGIGGAGGGSSYADGGSSAADGPAGVEGGSSSGGSSRLPGMPTDTGGCGGGGVSGTTGGGSGNSGGSAYSSGDASADAAPTSSPGADAAGAGSLMALGQQLVVDAYGGGAVLTVPEVCELFDLTPQQLLQPSSRRQLLAALLGALRDAHWAAAVGCRPQPAFLTPLSARLAAQGGVARLNGRSIERAAAAAAKRLALLPGDSHAQLHYALLLYFSGKYEDAWLELGSYVEAERARSEAQQQQQQPGDEPPRGAGSSTGGSSSNSSGQDEELEHAVQLLQRLQLELMVGAQ